MNEQNNQPNNQEKQHHNNGNRRRNNRGKPYYMKEKPKHDENGAEAAAQKPEQTQEPPAKAENKGEGKQNDRQNRTGGDNRNQNRQNQQNRQNRPKQNQPQLNKEQQPRQERQEQSQQNQQVQQVQQVQQNRQNRDHRNRNRGRRPDRRHEEDLQKLEQTAPEAVIEEAANVAAEGESMLSPVGEFEPNPMTADEMTPEISISIEDEEKPAVEVQTVTVSGVRFKSGGKVYYFEKGTLEPRNGDYVIVETARGAEFGEVAFATRKIPEATIVLPLRPILRLATEQDIQHHKDNKRMEDEAFGICLEKIRKHKLDMKLIEVQYSFDNSKLLFYFTSASRVDFRELVKDLASVFKTRIELRQIGIRDEAKIMGGLGACGRSLCCSTFLSDFVQVSIKMAKEQNLSLNSGKISGVCGRLMCCLQYEYSTYLDEASRTPPVDSTVKTKEGVGTVVEAVPLAAKVKVKLKDKPDAPAQYFHRDEVTVLSRGNQKKESD